MARVIAVMGDTGKGKTTSLFPNEKHNIIGLNPKETVLIFVTPKDIPMRNAYEHYKKGVSISEGGNFITTADTTAIGQIINYVASSRPEIKNIVVDDYAYTMGFQVMSEEKVAPPSVLFSRV